MKSLGPEGTRLNLIELAQHVIPRAGDVIQREVFDDQEISRFRPASNRRKSG